MSLPPWTTASSSQQELERSILPVQEALAVLWRQGGWDHRRTPAEAWRVVLGSIPYPDSATLATLPTFGPLDRLLEDEAITDIHLNGPEREVTVRRSGDLVEWGLRETWHADWLPWLVQQLRARGRGLATTIQMQGVVDVMRPGRRLCLLRYEAVVPPLCDHGPAITIRVLRPGQWSLEQLVVLGSLSGEAAELLAGAMRAGVDIWIVGTAGMGKTTLAQALLDVVADQRVLCIEDVSELVLTSSRAVRLDLTTARHLTFADLVRMALRMNPQRIVIGEVRGEEAYAVLASSRNGYPVLTTLHGESARHGLQNLVAMALEARETQARLDVAYATINARSTLIVALARHDGIRRVEEIIEVQRQHGTAAPTLETLYARQGDVLVFLTDVSSALRARLEAAGALPRRRGGERAA